MNAKIVVGFLAGAVAATTGAFLAVRRVAVAPAPVLTIIVKPPAAPDLTVPTPAAAAPAPIKPVMKTVARIETPPAFFLDPRPPEPTDPEPEPEPPVLSTAELKMPAPVVDLKLPPPGPHTVTIPAGTSFSVRLSEPLSTKSRRAGESFAGALELPLVIDGFIIAARGARVTGRIAESEQAGRVTGLARLSLELTQIETTDGQTIEVRTTHFVKSGPESKVEDGAKVALGAGLGAAIGAASARWKGAAIGAAAGAAAGAASVAMTRGKPAELPVESRLTFKLQDPVTITEKLGEPRP